MTVVCTAGFPHSEISGSLVVCTSPKLFAAYHVFHRLPVPRHPPCALSRITISLLRRDVRAGNTRSVACAGCLVCMTSSCPPWSFVFPRMSSLGLLSQTSIRYLSSLPYAVFKVRDCLSSHRNLESLQDSNRFSSVIFKGCGGHLSSHTVSNAVLSAAQVLTIVFGMGTGVTPERIATANS